MSNVSKQPRDINSGKPFAKGALLYHRAGWFPFPLKPRKKNPYDMGFTGRKNPWPADELEAITEQLRVAPPNCNIGIWLQDGYLGIDVDDYKSAKDDKTHPGGETLRKLERELGKLPDTWISSARSDGVSGIRLYRTPKGLQWPGKAGDGIDIVQKIHRFIACYPSWNPDAQSMYRWYPPGCRPDGKPSNKYRVDSTRVTGGFKHALILEADSVSHIPQASEVATLPAKWVDFLTRGRIKATERPIDMDSTVAEVDKWSKTGLAKYALPANKWCKELTERYKFWAAAVKSDPSSHDKITGAHWQFIAMGVEGHQGWGTAVERFEKFWSREAQLRGKRTEEEARRESFRSRTNALRQQKQRIAEAKEKGVNLVSPRCACFREGDIGPKGSTVVPEAKGAAADPADYDATDDGNAAHLSDLYKGQLIWVPGLGQWMFWNGKAWQREDEGHEGIAKRCFWKVRDRQMEYAKILSAAAREAIGTENEQALKERAKEWRAWAKHSGNNQGSNGALEAAKVRTEVMVRATKLDTNERLLGVENGVVELTKDGFAFRKAKHDDYVTVNTGVRFMEAVDLSKAGGTIAKGKVLWKNYLDRFLPDPTLRRFTQKTLGYCLLGSNPERLAVFLHGGTSTGKSTMLNVVMSALGAYAETVDLSIFKEKASGLNPALAQAMPRRIITSSEAGMQNHLHADLFKRMTGNDRISAELKGVNVIVTRIPAFTPVIATNSPPSIRGADAALNKRLMTLPFREQISDSSDEKSASLDLSTYASEIVLNWLVQGWAMYAREGLPEKEWPQVVKDETATFASQLNDIGEFMSDMTTPAKGSRVTVREMYDAYQRWCMDQRVDSKEQYTMNRFGRAMSSSGYPSKVALIDGASVRCYFGLAVNESKFTIKTVRPS